MNKRKFEIINCPHCGTEYLPGEIFVPKYLVGQPKNVVRDFQGQILDFEGNSMDVQETYNCDKCRKSFKIRCNIQFTTFQDKTTDVSEDYVTPIKRGSIFLKETD